MRIVKLKTADLEANIGQLPELPMNPRQWTKTDVDTLAKSLQETPELFEARPVLVVPNGDKFVILGGNMRFEASKALGLEEVPAIVFPATTPAETLKAIVIKDNGAFGSWDYDALANEWDDLPLADWGVPAWKTEHLDSTWSDGGRPNTGENGSLAAKFVAPPFTILDSRQGYWMERKKMWRGLIGDYGESRENTLAGGGYSQLQVLR